MMKNSKIFSNQLLHQQRHALGIYLRVLLNFFDLESIMKSTGPYAIFFSSLCVAISLYNLLYFLYVRIKGGNVDVGNIFKVSFNQKLRQLAWTFLLIHASSAIYTTVWVNPASFTTDTLSALLISCVASLVFNVLCLWIMKMKLMAISPQEAWIVFLLIFCTVACLKVPPHLSSNLYT